MSWDTVAGNWRQYRGKADEQWDKLTGVHQDMIANQRDELAGTIQNDRSALLHSAR